MYIFLLSFTGFLLATGKESNLHRKKLTCRKLGLVLRNYRQTFPASDGNETTRHKEDSKSE